MKGVFIVFHGLGYVFDKKSGVSKKIVNQVNVFNLLLGECKLIGLPENFLKIFPNKFVYLFAYMWHGMFHMYKSDFLDIKNIDYIYVRKPFMLLPRFLSFFKEYKKINPNGKILFEIPTYPYDQEYQTFFQKIFLVLEKHYRKKLIKCVDRIVTVSSDDEIFGVPTIKMKNGIDCSLIKPVHNNTYFNENEIHVIAVAQFAMWHGYDRFIKGLADFYNTGNHKEKIVLHLVGYGEVLDMYMEIVKNNSLDEFVVFHGPLYGDELSNIYELCDVALCSLGCHRVNVSTLSILKSREYLAYGIPIVASTKIDIIDRDWKYCKYIEENDNPVDIVSVIDFCKRIYLNNPRQTVVSEIRKFAEVNCDMKMTMKPVIDYINS